MKKYLVFLFVSFLLLSCNAPQRKGIDWSKLERKYSKAEDSLKLKAVAFLKENIGDISSEFVEFYKNEEKYSPPIKFSDFKNDTVFKAYLFSNNINYRIKFIPDTSILTTKATEMTIGEAFSDWRKFAWNKNVSIDDFLNYLLPYKVLDEFPDNWRKEVKRRYVIDIAKFIKNSNTDSLKKTYRQTNELYYAFNVGKMGDIFNYSPVPSYMSSRPGYAEMVCLRNGDCYGGSYLGVYFLRSVGIPSTVDFIPCWGSKNGTHAQEVFINEDGKITAPSGRMLNGCAKAFRVRFKRMNMWKDSIKPFVNPQTFILKNLQNNHWQDVTNEHTLVKDLVLPISSSLSYNYPYAYVCVFNYGKWVPIYWGKAINSNRSFVFTNMGYPMLYRIGVQEKNSFKPVGRVYLVDSTGRVSIMSPDSKYRINVSLKKLNTGAESWVEKGQYYDLFFINEFSNWELAASNICLNDSMVKFTNIPSNAIYRIIKRDDSRELSRPFTYSNGTQVWW